MKMNSLIDPKKQEDARRQLLNPGFSDNKQAPEPPQIPKKVLPQPAANTNPAPVGNFDMRLSHAIMHRDLNEVNRLIKAGADVNSSQTNMLERATMFRAWEVAGALISHGARPSCQAFFNLVSQEKTDLLQMLMDNGADVNIKDFYGKTALMFAAEGGFPKAAEFLVSRGAGVNLSADDGKTALAFAIEKAWYHQDRSEIINMLLRSGADTNVEYGFVSRHFNGKDSTPLCRAVACDSLQLVSLLIEHGADVNLRPEFGETALYRAVDRENVQLVSILAEHGADLDLKLGCGKTALELATKRNRMDIVKILKKHAPKKGWFS